MFSISDENIIRQSPELEHPASEQDPLATLAYNQTDVELIRDGVDRIEIFRHPTNNDRYCVRYMGYLAGSLLITREGLAELGTGLLTGDDEIPHWMIENRFETNERPWWVPETYEFGQTVDCDGCGHELSVRNVHTTGPRGPDTPNYCGDCIDDQLAQR